MRRISTNMNNDNMQYHLQRRNFSMNKLQNQMAGQSRIQSLRDDPLAAAQSTRYLSSIYRMERYSLNSERIQNSHRIAEGYLNSANDIMQRIRELTIQGGNDTFTPFEKKIMAEEVNQLLNELVEIANTRSSDGTSLFAGEKTMTIPYRVLEGNVPGADGRVITEIEYVGSSHTAKAEISDGSLVDINIAGNQAFWAENQTVISTRDSFNYVVSVDSAVSIAGESIQFRAGDNIHTIVAKINDSNAPVKASIDPVRGSLVMETTSPGQLLVEDLGGGTVFQDLGIVENIGSPPYNFARDAMVSGGSLFDMVIHLRNSLYEGNTISIGGGALKGIDLAHNKLISSMAELGARDERLQTVWERHQNVIPEIRERNSNAVDIDFAQAITDLKMLEYTHRAALQTAGRILQPTLLDFLR